MANTTGYGYLLGPAPQFFDANGKPLVGGKLFVYIAGTTTKAVTYSDFYKTENTNPVILNDLGTCMLIVPSENLYKIVLYDRKGNLLLTRDNVSVSSEQQIIYTTANKVESSDSTVDVTATTDPDTGIVTYDLSIKDEIDRAKEAEKGISDAIEAEKNRAESAESALSKSIADETERATKAEKGLADAIEAEKNRAEGVESSLSESIAGETDRATKAEKVLADAIEAEKNRAEEAERTLSESISEKAGTASPLMDGKASVGNSLKYAREDHVHPTDTSREDIANKTTVVLGTSNSKYPTDKAVAEFVNSSIATNTANYISNNGEPFTSVEQLEAYTGPVTNNDYAFVTGTDSEGNTYYDRYKATVNDSSVTWSLEYRLNNSSFTAAQWSAINSGITSALVAKIHTHSNKAVLDGITSSDVASWNSKQNSLTAGDNITIAGSTISSDQLFVATYGTTSYADVRAAYEAGKICVVMKGDVIGQIYEVTPNNIRFIMHNPVTKTAFSYNVNTNNTWTDDGYTAQTKLTFDSEPNAGSNNPVTSGGIKTALNNYVGIYKADSSNFHVKNNEYYSFICRTKISNWEKIQADFFCTDSDSSTVGKFNIFSTLSTKDTSLHTPERVAEFSGIVWDYNYHGYNSRKYIIYVAKSGDYFYFYAKRSIGNNASLTAFRSSLLYTTNPTLTDNVSADLDDATWQTLSLVELKNVYSSTTQERLDSHKNDTTVHITEAERKAWNAKQSALDFDDTPTAGSNNPVTSGGIKTAIDMVDAKGIVINEINGENVICFE